MKKWHECYSFDSEQSTTIGEIQPLASTNCKTGLGMDRPNWRIRTKYLALDNNKSYFLKFFVINHTLISFLGSM